MKSLRESSSATVQPVVSLRDQIRIEEERGPDKDRGEVAGKNSSVVGIHSSGNNKTAEERNNPKQRRLKYERRTTMDEIGSIQSEKHESPLLLRTPSSFSDSDDETSLSTVFDSIGTNEQETEMLIRRKEMTHLEIAASEKPSKKEFDVSAYMSWREMTPLQERVNAITVIPNPCYCLYFLLAGKWLSNEAIEKARETLEAGNFDTDFGTSLFDADGNVPSSWIKNMMEDDPDTIAQEMGCMSLQDSYEKFGCIRSTVFPNLHALPPLPVVAVAMGIILHMPFSFLYHWKYAHRLPPGSARIEHWSRRLDHAFIHVISACMSYATSGSWDYFFACAMFNIDCIYRQFKPRVRPRQNKIRIAISVTAYIIPILRRGDIILFVKLSVVLLISGWLFAKYPIGGWSHSAFHVAIALVPPLLMTAACHLAASKMQIQTAAMCAVLGEM